MEQATSLDIKKEVQFWRERRQIIPKYCHFTGLYPQSSSSLPFTYPLGNVIFTPVASIYPCAKYLELLAFDQILSLSLKAV